MSSASGEIGAEVTGDFSKIDEMLEGSDEEKLAAKQLLEEMYKSKPIDDCETLWRLARALHAAGAIALANGDSKKRQQLITEGIEYGQKALNADQNNANAHKWYAICIGGRSQYLSMKEKIKDGVVFKEHIDQALKIDSSDPALHNLSARFEFEVSQLSMMERKAASWLFAEVPQGTVENAIKGFEKTEQLKDKPWKENRLLLAKCYIAQKKYDVAVRWLDKALEVNAVNSEERGFDEEIKKLLKKYGSYRKS